MEAEEEEECHDHYVGGTEEDVDESMMESMFELSAYVSFNDNDNDNNNVDDEESNDENNVNLAQMSGGRNVSGAGSQGWTYLTAGDGEQDAVPDVTISIDGVDQRLLDRAREEVPAVLDKIKRKLFGKRKRDMSKISPSDFLKAFMDPLLLGYMKTFINSNISSSNPVSSSEIIAFVRVELMLSFYKVSPAMYFDEANTSNFPSATTIGMNLARYMQVLKCLNANSNVPSRSSVCGFASQYTTSTTGVWQAPMTHNRELATAMALVRRICSEVAFVPGTTDIGLDDDLLRLRSRKVVLEGYSQINNPNKGLGVIHHGAVSNCTSLYCGGHVASRNESTIDCVKILLLSLSGASIESQIRLNRTKFFWDRGYGGVEGAVNTFAIEKGAVLVGTSQRMKSFPFTFDQSPGPSRRLITEKGTMAAYWAVKGTGRQKQFALAHRSGLGRVVLMHTTDVDLGPGRYTLITRNGDCAKIRYCNPSDIVIPYIMSSVKILTELQRTPEWFLLRKFRITGTGAFSVWKILSARSGSELDENVEAVIRFLCLGCENNEQPAAPEIDDEHYVAATLQGKTLPELRIICRAKCLPVSGTKANLIERISSWSPQEERATAQQPATILGALMKSWFMAPFKSKACREGTLNEPFIFANLPAFVFLQKSREATGVPHQWYDIESLHEFGLLCHKDDTNAAFSPDAIAGVNFESPQGGYRFVALIEMKSKCSDNTLSEEMELMRQYGEYQIIDAEQDPLSFKLSIPDASYRCQLLHGMASGCLNEAFYVVASLRKIIRVVHIRVTSLIRQQYLSAIGNLGRQHLSWINHGVLPADMEIDPVSHAVDRHSVLTTLLLWREMSRMILLRGRPLPAGRHLLPEVVATWNRGKGPIDVYSRFQKSTKSNHANLGPIGAIWLRLLMTTVYNAYHSFNLSRTADFLASEECKSFKDFQTRRKRQPPFRQFCHMLAEDLSVHQVVAPMMYYNTSSSDEEDYDTMMMAGMSDNDEVKQRRPKSQGTSITVVYNKRDAYFTVPDLIAKRMNRRIAHHPCSAQTQSSCVWCCRMDHSRGQQHSRHGRKTTWHCSICEVSLCKVKRYNDRSCFVLFHVSHDLFDPCCVQAQQMMVPTRTHKNRHTLIPRRRCAPVAGDGRAESDDASVDDEDLPVPAAIAPPDRGDSSAVPPEREANNLAQQVDEQIHDEMDDEYIPENCTDNDGDESGERPAIRRRTCSNVIAIPQRSTRRSPL